MIKAIYWDMDGTIADLYGFDGWLEMLHNENVKPYAECGDLVDTEELFWLLNAFVARGVTVGVISWGAMGGSREYCKATKKAKREWINARYPDIFSEFHVVKYGTPKHHVRNIEDSILVDDNAEVRNAWKGATIDASDTKNMLAALRKILAAIEKENEKC